MERARWLPGVLAARRVFIKPAGLNTASYYEGGRQETLDAVVVGTKFETDLFLRRPDRIVEFNPYWGVPQSIIINEMLPKAIGGPVLSGPAWL